MHRSGAVLIALVAGCGRIGFDGPDPAGDAYGAAVLATTPVAYWRLDERAGSIAHDVVGGFDGTYQGGCTLGALGAVSGSNTAVVFDGTSCSITIGDVLEFAGMTPFSIELWAKLTVNSNSVRWLVSHSTPGTPKSGYSLAFQDTTLWFEQIDHDVSIAYVPTTIPTLGSFHHVVFTTNAQRQRLYVDGKMVTEQPFVASEPADTGPLVFGDYAVPDPNKLAGTLDEVAFYARELDPATIAAHLAAR